MRAPDEMPEEDSYMTIETLKQLARRFAAFAASQKIELKHGQALNLVAAMFGLRNWSEVVALPAQWSSKALDLDTVARLSDKAQAFGVKATAAELLEALTAAEANPPPMPETPADDRPPVSATEVMTYRSAAEVLAIARLMPDNPVTKDNYARVRGDYHTEPDYLRCCFQEPNGILCREEHFFGFVVEKSDGTLSIVGNECARKKLSVDNERIRADINRYQNEKRRRDAVARLTRALGRKDEILERLRALRQWAESVGAELETFKEQLGHRTLSRLLEMARTGNTAIMIKSVTIRRYTDEEGKAREERMSAPIRIGSFAAAELLLPGRIAGHISAAADVEVALRYAESIALGEARASVLDAAAGRIEAFDGLERQATADLSEAYGKFKENDLSLLCFLTSDPERFKTARLALSQAGQHVGKDSAKKWLFEKEAALKSSLGADRIEINL